jgi:hypothetical protein
MLSNVPCHHLSVSFDWHANVQESQKKKTQQPSIWDFYQLFFQMLLLLHCFNCYSVDCLRWYELLFLDIVFDASVSTKNFTTYTDLFCASVLMCSMSWTSAHVVDEGSINPSGFFPAEVMSELLKGLIGVGWLVLQGFVLIGERQHPYYNSIIHGLLELIVSDT